MTPSKDGYFGRYGGAYTPREISNEIKRVLLFYRKLFVNKKFVREFYNNLCNLSGRPTPIYYARNLSRKYKNKIFFKREDLNHTGSHKINNVMGQISIARLMGKSHIIAETGAGQHGVAVSSVCAMMGMPCTIFVGSIDFVNQQDNIKKIKRLGATLVVVEGSLTQAVTQAIEYYRDHIRECYYMIGSTVGPCPFPEMVRNFQRVIGKECYYQMRRSNINIDYLISCVGGGSNSIGISYDFIRKKGIKLIAIEAGGNNGIGSHAIRYGSRGLLHGCITKVIRSNRKVESTSISSGLRYPSIGPEHAYLNEQGMVWYGKEKDKHIKDAYRKMVRYEGIIPSLESCHAISRLIKISRKIAVNKNILINLSGKGEKDEDIIKQ
ncbi:tryptophan synthase subunit beta [Candidatus Vidania fulgoroideorum]